MGARDICWTEARHRHLIEERLEQMVISLVDQRQFNVGESAKALRRIDACESASHNDNPYHVTPLRDIMPRMIRNAYPSDLPTSSKSTMHQSPGRLATADTEPVPIESRREWFVDRDFSRHPIWICEDPMRPGRISGG
jgi:hypothetical protein